MPLKEAHIESLREVLCNVPDPRAGNRSWFISTLLNLICIGLFAGRTSLASIHHRKTTICAKSFSTGIRISEDRGEGDLLTRVSLDIPRLR